LGRCCKYRVRKPPAAVLKKLNDANGPTSNLLAVAGVRRLLKQLPEDVQKTIDDCERCGDIESLEWKSASA
jgi:L-proline amide hydrolase